MSGMWLKLLRNKTVVLEECDLASIYSLAFTGIVSAVFW